jgi:hypothetical protein
MMPWQMYVLTRLSNGTIQRALRRSTSADNSFDFMYLEQVVSVSPSSTFADGDNLTVTGSGFTQSNGIYTCVLRRDSSNGTLTSRTAGFPINSTTLLCRGVFWSFQAGNASFYLERSGQDDTVIDVPRKTEVNMTIIEAWTRVNESTVASAALLTVSGGGFDVTTQPSPYTCHFSVQGLTKNATATVVDTYTLLCDGGEWLGPAGTGTLSLRLNNVPNTPLAKAGISVLSAAFVLRDSLVGVLGSPNGTALGNATVIFKGEPSANRTVT